MVLLSIRYHLSIFIDFILKYFFHYFLNQNSVLGFLTISSDLNAYFLFFFKLLPFEKIQYIALRPVVVAKWQMHMYVYFLLKITQAAWFGNVNWKQWLSSSAICVDIQTGLRWGLLLVPAYRPGWMRLQKHAKSMPKGRFLYTLSLSLSLSRSLSLAVLGMEFRVLHMLDKLSATELQPQSLYICSWPSKFDLCR
jgi:hypothetical protein